MIFKKYKKYVNLKLHQSFKRFKSIKMILAVMCVGLFLHACNDPDFVADANNSGNNGNNNNNNGNQTSGGTVAGEVSNGVTNEKINNAKISVGNLQMQTDAAGSFTLPNVPEGTRLVVRVQAQGFSDGFQLVDVAKNATSRVAIRLIALDVSQSVSSDVESTTNLPNSSGALVLQASSLVRSDGSAATGNVSVGLSAINPARNVKEMPGDYRIATASGEIAYMESFGALAIQLKDSTGEPLNLAPNKTATVRIPLLTRHLAPSATIPLFYFDEKTGFWREEGSASLKGSGNNRYYEGTVTHFSYWNADIRMDTIFVNGCVSNESNARAANVRVESDGIDYSGSTWVLTDANGNFRLPIKRSSRAIVSAQLGDKLTNSVSTEPSDKDITLGECLTLAALVNATTIKLTWGERPKDVDSHLFTPDNFHIYFSRKGSLISSPFANLDVDDVDSFGPEVVTLRRLMVGTYRYSVHNYSETYNPGMTSSPVRVELNRAGNITVFTPPAGEISDQTDWWNVFTFTVDDRCNVSVQPVQTWTTKQPPAINNPPTVTFCTP